MFDWLTVAQFVVPVIIAIASMYFVIVWQIRRAFGPTISKAFGILGTKSAGNRQLQAVKNDMLEGILDSPKMTAIKVLADQFGFDIDGMFEKHGPEKTIQGLLELLGMLGINPMDLLAGGIGKGLLGNTPQGSGENPFLRRP